MCRCVVSSSAQPTVLNHRHSPHGYLHRMLQHWILATEALPGPVGTMSITQDVYVAYFLACAQVLTPEEHVTPEDVAVSPAALILAVGSVACLRCAPSSRHVVQCNQSGRNVAGILHSVCGVQACVRLSWLDGAHADPDVGTIFFRLPM